MMTRALAIAIVGLAPAGCDSSMLHQDRPGGSDYQPGAYGADQLGTPDSLRREDEREYCRRYPRQCGPRG